jgi:hypothetical protein
LSRLLHISRKAIGRRLDNWRKGQTYRFVVS